MMCTESVCNVVADGARFCCDGGEECSVALGGS